MLDVTPLTDALWIGSKAQTGPALRQAGFDDLVLCAEEWQPPPEAFPGLAVLHAPFSDAGQPPTQQEVEIALAAAGKTVERLNAGRRCLVTCMAGRNRSGLVCALALAEARGIPADQAGQVVRDLRPTSLTNMYFRGLLKRVVSQGRSPKPCELCEAKPITPRYWEDAICWIADCKQCPGVPMAVFKPHGTQPTRRQFEHMVELLKMCGKGRRYELDDSMRSIPDHYHVHLRPRE